MLFLEPNSWIWFIHNLGFFNRFSQCIEGRNGSHQDETRTTHDDVSDSMESVGQSGDEPNETNVFVFTCNCVKYTSTSTYIQLFDVHIVQTSNPKGNQQPRGKKKNKNKKGVGGNNENNNNVSGGRRRRRRSNFHASCVKKTI
jgi:hypothetical protein